MQYGYCRVSTKKQSIERQIKNIKAAYPNAIIVKEVYSGAHFEGRKEFEKLIDLADETTHLIFDSVSRFSRNADEAFAMYMELFSRNTRLSFIKEPYIDSDVFKEAMSRQIELTGSDLDFILQGINQYLIAVAEKQIKIAFAQSEKELQDIRTRTSEALQVKKLQGTKLGRETGKKYPTMKEKAAKRIMLAKCRDFGQGSNSDVEVMLLSGISKNTFYKYKRELKEEFERGITYL